MQQPATRAHLPTGMGLGTGWMPRSGMDWPIMVSLMLAAGAVVLKLNRQLNWLAWRNIWVRFFAVAGLGVFVIVALAAWLLPGLAAEPIWLRWPPEHAKYIILLIEVFATLAIAITLTLLVVAEQPATPISLERPDTAGGSDD